jgi:hypothetical protein
MGHQGTGPVLTGAVCRREGDNGEKMEGVGGPSMDADFEKWHLVMQNKWRKMQNSQQPKRR